ncbi:MAG: LysM peptidoglycan-binding domain-containing protein [Candidatus Promineifilaceae bacterium]
MRSIGLLVLFVFALLLPTVVFAQETSEAETDSAETTDLPVIHTIAAGDTLYSISAQYNVSIPDLERINNLAPDAVLSIGQELIISGFIPLPIGASVLDAPDLLHIAGLPDAPRQHIVQGGESIQAIADQYQLDLQLLLDANRLQTNSVLQIGQHLLVPGIPGELFARDYVVQFGDSLAGLASQFNVPPANLLVDDLVVNPHNLVVGQTLRVVSRTGSAEKQPILGHPHRVEIGETLTTIGAHYNQPPQSIARANGLPFPSVLVVGQPLRIPSDDVYRALSAELTTLQISHDSLRQGESFTLYLESTDVMTPTGRIRFTEVISAPIQSWFYTTYEQSFRFAPYQAGYVAVVGLDSFTHPGLYDIELFTDGDEQADFVQSIEVTSIDYGFQAIPLEDVLAVRSAENARLMPIYTTYSVMPTFSITEPFSSPLNDAYRSAAYGAARSYGGAPVRIFHSGVDFAAPVSTPIQAVADGMIVFSEFTELRGNVVIIDHGLGIKTGYFHLSQMLAETGEFVTRGTAIGALGNTGLSTGAHLHWDVRINNVPVNGMQWLAEPVFPFE